MDDEQLELFDIKKPSLSGDYRICSKCNEEKHISEYRLQMGGKSYRTECKNCSDKKIALRIQLMKENPKPIDPNYHCPICQKTEEQLKINGQFPDRSVWALDHNHTTHKFRAWICNNCNTGLGRFNDSVEVVEQALKYLKKDYKK